ncbi:hypothetical protein [Streptomyces sp. Da 82-17]|uniref:hypothetical protein n=1 Tax=Streptomyces sp. Da 82-17 TaxID=3377116 RepID=UPI0038D51317
MPVRPARRPRPALAAVVVGALLACAYLMWGPGHSTMPMPMPTAGTAGQAMSAAAGHAETEQPAGAPTREPAQAQSEQRPGQHSGHVVAPMPGECPDTSMECPLATAHPPLPVAFAAAPGPGVLAEPPASAEPLTAAADEGCAWPRAPDPVALLCVSRT